MVEDRVLASLPTAEVEKGAFEVFAAVKEVMQAVWFPRIPQSSQASVKVISNVLHDMTQHKCPRGVGFLKSTSFLRKVEAGLSFMVKEICADGTILLGSAAIEAELDKYLEQLHAQLRVTYGDLTPLAVFEWLLPPTRHPDLERCRDGVIEAMEQEGQVVAVRAETLDVCDHVLNDLEHLSDLSRPDTAAIESEEDIADPPLDMCGCTAIAPWSQFPRRGRGGSVGVHCSAEGEEGLQEGAQHTGCVYGDGRALASFPSDACSNSSACSLHACEGEGKASSLHAC